MSSITLARISIIDSASSTSYSLFITGSFTISKTTSSSGASSSSGSGSGVLIFGTGFYFLMTVLTGFS